MVSIQGGIKIEVFMPKFMSTFSVSSVLKKHYMVNLNLLVSLYACCIFLNILFSIS